MSREFHEVYSGYFHSVLNDVESDRPRTGEPVADAIRDILIALAPIEYAVASHQACDSHLSRVVIASAKNADRVRDAAAELLKAIGYYNEIVSTIVRENIEGRLDG